MRIPEIQERLKELSKEIEALSTHLSRRKPAAKAKAKCQKMTPAIASAVRRMKKTYPGMSQLEIGKQFNINPGRVSEVLRGEAHMSYLFPFAGDDRPRPKVKAPIIKQPLIKITRHERDLGKYPEQEPFYLPAMRSTLKKILFEVAEETGVSVYELAGPQRYRRLIGPRAKFVYRARTETGLSYPLIARALCRDHSTVVNLYNRYFEIFGVARETTNE